MYSPFAFCDHQAEVRGLWASVFRILALVIIGCMLMLAALERSMIFFPGREILATPEQLGLDYESVELVAGDSTKLHGWWIPAARSRAALLFFHGNAGNIGDRLDSIAVFHRLGLTVLIIDYRGYGSSEGRPSEQGTYEDALAAWNYLTRERALSPSEIIVFGRSLGAAVAIWLAVGRSPRALIVESPFTSIAEMTSVMLPFLPVRLPIRTRYDNLARIGNVRCPVLVAHSIGDDIIPFSHGRRLFEAAPEPKRFLEMRGSHNDGFLVTGAAYTAGLSSFLDECGIGRPDGREKADHHRENHWEGETQ